MDITELLKQGEEHMDSAWLETPEGLAWKVKLEAALNDHDVHHVGGDVHGTGRLAGKR
jgi:hypothetical protein